jgi:hypothetical protein
LALEFYDSNYRQFIGSRDEITGNPDDLYQRIQSHLYDVDCNFVYYIDPKNFGSFGEIKWQDFYKNNYANPRRYHGKYLSIMN